MPNHVDILMNTARTLKDRTTQYGDPAETYQRAASIASVTLGKSLTHYDIVMIMHAVKLSRMVTGRSNLDHYEDAINYLAFAAEFATDEKKDPPTYIMEVPVSYDVSQPSEVDMDALERDLYNVCGTT